MSRPFRNIAGIFLIILGIIGTLLPIIPGFVFFAAAAGVLGSDHFVVRWAWKWLAYFKILKPPADEAGTSETGKKTDASSDAHCEDDLRANHQTDRNAVIRYTAGDDPPQRK